MTDTGIEIKRPVMRSFTIEVDIPDDLREQFAARVRAYGGDERQYVREVVERDLRAEAPHAGMPFSELLSLAAGPSPADELSEQELTEFAEAEVQAHRVEKRQGRGTQRGSHPQHAEGRAGALTLRLPLATPGSSLRLPRDCRGRIGGGAFPRARPSGHPVVVLPVARKADVVEGSRRAGRGGDFHIGVRHPRL